MERMTFAAAKTTNNGRTITFLANSGKPMVNGLTVDLDTLRVPVTHNNVTEVIAFSDYKPETDQLTVPLLVDHVPSTDMQAGLVTKLWRDDQGLWAEARLSEVEEGEKVRTLAAEGMLTNSFSITIDCPTQPGKDGILHNSELVEISVVYRGADSRAVFRSLNNRKDGAMQVNTDMTRLHETIKGFKLSDEEKSALSEAVQSVLQDALSGIVDAINEQSENSGDTGDGEAPAEPQPATQSSNKRNGMTIIINKANPAVHQSTPIARVNNDRKSWLDSHAAFLAMEESFRRTDNGGDHAFRNDWANTVKEKMADTASFASGVAEDDISKLIPTEAITTIEDALNTRGSGLWNMYRKTGLDTETIGANLAGINDDTSRAHGYPVDQYGTAKKEQTITLVSRVLTADYTYKKISLNKGDIRRTQRPGALLRYVLQELPNRIVQTIERQTVLGGYDDMAHFRSLVDDSKEADVAGKWAGNKFALTLTRTDGQPLLMDFVKAAHKVKANGPKVLVCDSDTVTELLLSLDANGRPLLTLGDENLARILGVSQIITPEWWDETDNKTLLGAVFVPSAYDIVGDSTIEAFTDFNLSTNTNEYLQEIYAGGGLSKIKSAALIMPSTASSSSTGKSTTK